MLDGSVSRIRLEPPGQAGIGVELEVDADGATWGEQVKDTAGNWTINKLTREGVFDAISRPRSVSGDPFVSSLPRPATDLGTLADRARRCESFAEYAEALGDSRRAHLTNVTTAWEVFGRGCVADGFRR